MDWQELLRKIEEIKKQAAGEMSRISEASEKEQWRIKYLGRKGHLHQLTSLVGKAPLQLRRKLGAEINNLKQYLLALYQEKKEAIRDTGFLNVSLPGHRVSSGQLHPLTTATREMVKIFTRMGFGVYTGPDMETDYYNFEALNMPANHPARDMWDTFYLNEEGTRLLRTHTSPVQIRVMEKITPPFRIIAVGRCFRRDPLDASHSPVFHQMEGLMVGSDICFSHLKGILIHFCQEFFGHGIKVKFSPSYFPFTEPSAEVSISCVICGGTGCTTCSRKGWLEILGCGMVHPRVFQAVGYEKDKIRGFAFGMGVERIAMLRHGITDIRFFLQNDLRFIQQVSS